MKGKKFMQPSITFETKAWEGDWRLILNTGRLKKIIEACRYSFNERILYINNVDDRDRVKKAAVKYLENGILTSVVFVDDIVPKALEYFKMDKDSFKGGYYYSVQELAGIYNCRTKYLLHMTGDSIITSKESWIAESMERMETDSSIFAANPNGDMQDVKQNLVEEEKDFYKGFGFSDQCYLIRVEDFRKPIYNEDHEASNRYPDYGGELFEKKVDSYMHNHGLYRLTSKKAVYKHQNFPKDPVRRALLYLTGINLKKGR
jgi:hypothetical protein